MGSLSNDGRASYPSRRLFSENDDGISRVHIVWFTLAGTPQ